MHIHLFVLALLIRLICSILNDFFFHNSDASIWSRSKRERNRIFQKATAHQKQFLCLPLHIFQKATNVCSLIKAVVQYSPYTVDELVTSIHENMPKIDDWLPELIDLQFVDSTESNDADEESHTSKKASIIPNPNTRELRKRKVFCIHIN